MASVTSWLTELINPVYVYWYKQAALFGMPISAGLSVGWFMHRLWHSIALAIAFGIATEVVLEVMAFFYLGRL